MCHLGKQFEQCIPQVGGGCFVKLTESFSKSQNIDRTHLIECDFARSSRESARDTRWKARDSSRHWGDDYRNHMLVHFLRRNNNAWPSLAHFCADSRIKPHKVNIKANGDQPAHHVHSVSSNALGIFCQSAHSWRSRSRKSGGSSASAFLNASSHPARGRFSPVGRRTISSPRTAISTPSLIPACSITALGKRTPREFPIRISLVLIVPFFRRFKGLFAEVFRGDFNFISTL
jgi:hypothetical protein